MSVSPTKGKMFEMAFNYDPLKEIINYLLERDKEINVFMSKVGSNFHVQDSTKTDVSKSEVKKFSVNDNPYEIKPKNGVQSELNKEEVNIHKKKHDTDNEISENKEIEEEMAANNNEMTHKDIIYKEQLDKKTEDDINDIGKIEANKDNDNGNINENDNENENYNENDKENKNENTEEIHKPIIKPISNSSQYKKNPKIKRKNSKYETSSNNEQEESEIITTKNLENANKDNSEENDHEFKNLWV